MDVLDKLHILGGDAAFDAGEEEGMSAHWPQMTRAPASAGIYYAAAGGGLTGHPWVGISAILCRRGVPLCYN